jgi:hypothetical protein
MLHTAEFVQDLLGYLQPSYFNVGVLGLYTVFLCKVNILLLLDELTPVTQ